MKSNLNKEIATREFSNSYYKYIGYLPNPDKILSKTGKSIEIYSNLKNDPHVWACIQSRKSGLVCLNYEIIDNGCENKLLNEVKSIFANLDIHQIERDILEALLFGFQPIEIIWNYSKESKQIYPEKLIAKPQEWFVFDMDEIGRAHV